MQRTEMDQKSRGVSAATSAIGSLIRKHTNLRATSIPGKDTGSDDSPQLSDGEKAYRFLRQIVRDERVTLLAISVAGGPPRATSFSINDRRGILAWLTRHGGVDNCYFQVNPLRNDVRNRKATKAELKHVVQLHVDIDDLKGLDRLREFELPPTAVVCSGNGYHGYWQLAEPPADLAQAEGLNLRLCERLGGDRGTQNADRILRVPFTSNIPDAKKQDHGKVTVRAHVVDDLTDFAGCTPRRDRSRADENGTHNDRRRLGATRPTLSSSCAIDGNSGVNSHRR